MSPPRSACAVIAVLLLSILVSSPAAASTTPPDFLAEAASLHDWLVGVRRHLHQIPEILYDLPKTSGAVQDYLTELGIPFKSVANTGLVATLGTGSAPIVALRADMDALPITEDTGFNFSSRHAGRMHACGHDAHMTMLLGGARLLKKLEPELRGTVRLLFQPAEEGGAGGQRMVTEGALEGVGAAFGFHVWPTVPTGAVATRPGFMMAGSLRFELDIVGRGGHAAIPELLVDPVVASAAVIQALQTLVARETSPFDSAVISIPKLVAGKGRDQAHNVVPDSVFLGGVVRAASDEAMQRLRKRVEEIVAGVTAAYGCDSILDWVLEDTPYYPPTVNDEGAYSFAAGVITKTLGEEGLVTDYPGTMAAEDFSFIARAVPSAFMFLGIRNESAGALHGLHTDKFTLDEQVLHRGAALHASLAFEYISRHAGERPRATELVQVSSDEEEEESPANDEL